MAFTYGKLIPVTPVTAVSGSVAQVLYVNQSGSKTYIASMDFHNTAASGRNVEVFVVPASTANSSSNRTVKTTLNGDDTYMHEPKYPYVLTDAGESLQVLCNGTGVNAYIRGGTE
jgi:hypothetical protein